jgi:dTDP-3-amino-3,4,6-trideoxy-alpha-D-glucose transaminase
MRKMDDTTGNPILIPMQDLTGRDAALRPEIDRTVRRVLDRGRFILDRETADFEREFAAYCGTAHAVGVASGTDALCLALQACGVRPGDEVVTVAFSSVATAASIRMAGARPVFVDIHPRRFTLDPERLEDAVTPRTRAVVPVHLFGCAADLDPILEIARRRGLAVVEDCAQAHGAVYRGRRVGAWGDVGAFSFYPTKNLGALGDGGAVVCADPAIAARIRRLRQYGWDDRRISMEAGMNSRLDELQAAVLRVKLRHLDEANAARRERGSAYSRLLPPDRLTLPLEPGETLHVYHQYAVLHPERDRLRGYLLKHGVETAVHYPVPIHRQPAFETAIDGEVSLPATEQTADRILSLPIYPNLSEEHQRRIAEWVSAFPR